MFSCLRAKGRARAAERASCAKPRHFAPSAQSRIPGICSCFSTALKPTDLIYE
jgi:hypothetical protein